MQLVAAVGIEAETAQIAAFSDPNGRYHLHPVAGGDVAGLIAAIARLGFAGALLFDPRDAVDAAASSARASLTTRALGVADALVVTAAGVVAENHHLEAIASALAARGWHPRGAKVAIYGSGEGAEAAVRALSRLGVGEIGVIARHRPDAERIAAQAGSGVARGAYARGDAGADLLSERADLIVRCGGDVPLPTGSFGPHLTLLDLALAERRPWQRAALLSGVVTISARDVEAHRMQHALRTILSEPVVLEPLLALWHGG
jgi:hypothetical protein